MITSGTRIQRSFQRLVTTVRGLPWKLAFVATPPYVEFLDELLLDVLWNRSRSLKDEKCGKELADVANDFRIGRIVDCVGHPSGLQYD